VVEKNLSVSGSVDKEIAGYKISQIFLDVLYQALMNRKTGNRIKLLISLFSTTLPEVIPKNRKCFRVMK